MATPGDDPVEQFRADGLAAVDESPPRDGLLAARRRDGATDA
ncbi:MAG: hypothetical protein ACOCZD_00285 [Haloferacaceae archaeon]